ncbi:hypothetical protein BDR22DRAFT_845513 [Usnea florida]
MDNHSSTSCEISRRSDESVFYLKTAKGEVGRRLMEGEFHAISGVHNVDNLFAPKPHAWGK